MQEKDITIGNANVKIITVNTVVIGTGASGFNTADRLWQYGQKDIILISENVNFGTSRNSGSDKQTYYKLSLSGEASDSVRHLAEILFSGRCVDGEHALCEAALSSQCFFRLLELGVPFPRNRYGEYIGYKTDHDPAERATSIGPYTSKKMTECLQSSVESKGIRILDKVLPIQIIKKDDEVAGLLCARLDCLEPSEPSFMAFNCRNIVFATGGPAAIYADSVYPRNQFGAHAVAFEAGVTGKNLTEWQFGLASIKPRWNVSGTYMQVLPRFVSTDKNGNDQREFLSDYYVDSSAMLSNVFLKGYQWPFDARKTTGGSSLIDLFVYEEIFTRERRVFLDYRTNPGNEDVDFSSLDDEAHIYLEKAGACFGTPFERLQKMNAPAVNFYKEHGVDLSSEMLEISLCAQHNNGGLSVDLWWQTNIPGVFSVGEAAATHGVYRPGGSALNAGQVGSTRAAHFIAAKRRDVFVDTEGFVNILKKNLETSFNFLRSGTAGREKPQNLIVETTERMSRVGGAVRNKQAIESAINAIRVELENFSERVWFDDTESAIGAIKYRQILITQFVYLNAMLDYINCGGKSRGSALYTDFGGCAPHDALSSQFAFQLESAEAENEIQEITLENGNCKITWREAREIPEEDSFFENVWRSFRENGNVY